MENMVTENTLSFFRNKKVFITGHTGFKGSWLSFILDFHGVKVKGFSKKPNTNPNLFDNLSFSKSFDSVIGDIKDYELLKREILNFKPDFIFHLAAQPIVMESYKDPVETFNTNFNGTLNLLESIRELNQCSVVIITTDKVYDNNETKLSFKETDKLGGKDPYSSSKSASELLIASYSSSFFSDTNINISTARAGNIIGGGDWSLYRLLPDVIRCCFEKSELTIRNPESVRPWQHVLDPIFGYIELARKLNSNPEKHKGSWNFGPDENNPISVKEIIDMIITKGLQFNIRIQNDITKKESKFLQLDISKSKNILNWTPKWSTEDSVEHTINWYKDFYNNIPANDLIINDLKKYLKQK
jgi:CDP-glucose 4,6-dehydratase